METKSGSTVGSLAGVQNGDDIFQELHAFRFQSRGGDERVVGRNICNAWVVLVLKLLKVVSFTKDHHSNGWLPSGRRPLVSAGG